MNNEIKTLVLQQDTLEGILQEFIQKLPESDLLTPALEALTSLKADFNQRLKQAEDAGRNLNIAIMGQVKAGKSSFLNALLFNGKSVLPEAATPKTANLTRISYSDTPSLTIEFYEKGEWDSIVQIAASSGTDSMTRAAKELIEIASDQNIDIAAILEKGREVIEAKTPEELMGILNAYTGNNGEYTALVKMTHLHLPLEELKGFDIVDTPGMNDPVVSRTERTKEEMSRSDVVFFLSRCSQFLDQSDMSLLSEQLPGKGVKRLVLVGGQFDSAILDEGENRKSLEDTEQHIQKRLSSRACKEMEALAAKAEELNPDRAKLLRTLRSPILSSTYAYNFANFPEEQWSENAGMKHVYEQLVETAEYDWNSKWTHADWVRIANFEPLQEAYHKARNEKDEIIQEQLDSFVPESVKRLEEFKTHLIENIDNRLRVLEHDDLQMLKEQKDNYMGQINGISIKLADELDVITLNAEKVQKDVIRSLRRDQKNYSNVQEQTGTEVKYYNDEVDVSTWYKPWTWGNKKTVERSQSTSYQYVSASDAASRVREFSFDCIISIEDAFDKIINVSAIRIALKKALVNYLPTDSKDFDPMFFRNVIDSEIGQVHVPDLNLDCSHLVQDISNKFQGEIRGSDIDSLRMTLAATISDVFAYLITDYEVKTKEIINLVDTLKRSLSEKLTERLSSDLDKLEQEFSDKENVIAHYYDLKKAL